MTDHNAEGGKKVEPCAWCGRQSEVEPEPVLYDIEFCMCRCPLAFPDSLTIGDWNAFQRRILEQRRKDFNAGYAFANHMERCSGEPDFIWSYAPKFFNYEDDGRPEEIDAFEMYLAKDRK